MPKQTAPGIGLGFNWDLGESGEAVKDGLDENFLRTSVLVNLSVVSRTTSLPVSPSNNTVYIVPSGDSRPNQVAVRVSGEWRYFAPKRNWEARVVDEGDAKVVFDGSSWVEADAYLKTLIADLTARVAALEG